MDEELGVCAHYAVGARVAVAQAVVSTNALKHPVRCLLFEEQRSAEAAAEEEASAARASNHAKMGARQSTDIYAKSKDTNRGYG